MAVLETFVALACETTTCTVTGFAGSPTCAPALQVIKKESQQKTWQALLTVSLASKFVPQPETNLIRVIGIAIQGVGLQPPVLHGKEHIGAHSIYEINKRTLVSRK